MEESNLLDKTYNSINYSTILYRENKKGTKNK